VAFVIVFCSPGGVVATTREQVAASRSWVALLGHGARGLDLDHEVKAPSGLVGLGSQGRGSATHSVVGGAVRPSCRGGFRRQCRTRHHRPAVLSCQHRGTEGWRLPRDPASREAAVPSVVAE
jgi:hypothetical protein